MNTITARLSKLVLPLILAFMAGCTHNNGDIGIWFGTWLVESITQDGSTHPVMIDGTLCFQFQGEIATIRQTTISHDEFVDYGTWREGDGKLYILFSDPNVAYSHVLETVAGLKPNAGDGYHFTVEHTGGNLHLTLVDVDDHLWHLRLRKL